MLSKVNPGQSFRKMELKRCQIYIYKAKNIEQLKSYALL